MKTEEWNREFKEIFGDLKELEDLLTERIADFHEVKGMIQARHAYIFYRSYVYKITKKLNKISSPPKD